MVSKPTTVNTKNEWIVVYQLRKDIRRVEAVQQATLTTAKFGLARTHGLFSSDEWWNKLETGKLVLYTLKGIITKLYMGGMNDSPEFSMRSDSGKECNWLRYANGKELSDVYVTGRPIEIDYALQRRRFLSSLSFLRKQKIVIEIRIKA